MSSCRITEKQTSRIVIESDVTRDVSLELSKTLFVLNKSDLLAPGSYALKMNEGTTLDLDLHISARKEINIDCLLERIHTIIQNSYNLYCG